MTEEYAGEGNVKVSVDAKVVQDKIAAGLDRAVWYKAINRRTFERILRRLLEAEVMGAWMSD